MTDRRPAIFLSAAEASADEHAAKLIRAILRRVPDARIVGTGGAKMADAGCELLEDLTASASMLSATFLRVPYYIRLLRRLRSAIREIAPHVHVPVDSPALNWHLAAATKEAGGRVMYFIAPQVWAWAPWRVKKVRRLTDRVACILPFEQRYLRDRGVKATYVGHPLFDEMPPRPDPLPDLVEAWHSGAWTVAMLPGSRPAEIKHHTPALVTTADAIRQRWPRARCVFCTRDERATDALRRLAGREDIEIAVGRTRDVLAGAHFAVAVSGTVTLEVAYYGVPMVVFYRASRLAYKAIGKHLIRTPHLSLVNILAGRRLVPELMPWHGNRRQVADLVLEVMADLGCLFDTRQALLDVVDSLTAGPGRTAADNAADLVLDLLAEQHVTTP